MRGAAGLGRKPFAESPGSGGGGGGGGRREGSDFRGLEGGLRLVCSVGSGSALTMPAASDLRVSRRLSGRGHSARFKFKLRAAEPSLPLWRGQGLGPTLASGAALPGPRSTAGFEFKWKVLQAGRIWGTGLRPPVRPTRSSVPGGPIAAPLAAGLSRPPSRQWAP